MYNKKAIGLSSFFIQGNHWIVMVYVLPSGRDMLFLFSDDKE